MANVNKTVDVAALDLLCDKLECGDANHRATAEQIRKAMNGAERTKTEYDGVDVDALLKLADHLNKRMSYDPKGDNLLADAIRDAVKGAKPQLPDGIEWPRFEDGKLVKFGDKFIDVHGYEATAKMIIFGAEGFVFNAGYSSKCCRNYGEPVKRPEPEVLDADGVPIKVGDTVWDSKGESHEVVEINVVDDDEQLIWCGKYLNSMKVFHIANEVTHRKPDTLESVVTEMLAEWDENSEEFLDMDSYFARFRKLMGGE